MSATLTQHSLPHSAITLKWTCDEAGNWRQVPMILAKTEQGWSDTPPQAGRYRMSDQTKQEGQTMATVADRERKNRKEDAVRRRLEEMRGHELHLLSLMDETKLDLMILALGVGETILHEPA